MAGSHGGAEHLGFSLKPPKWLRNLVGGAASAADTIQAATSQGQRVLTAADQAATEPMPRTVYAVTDQPSSWILPVGVAALAAFLLLRKK